MEDNREKIRNKSLNFPENRGKIREIHLLLIEYL